MRETMFSYVCEQCQQWHRLRIIEDVAYCPNCGRNTSVIDDRVLVFSTENTNQNEYFDKLYSVETDQADYYRQIYGLSGQPAGSEATGEHTLYNALAQNAKDFAELSGLCLDRDFVDLDILEVACGSGWVTGTLMRAPAVSHCRFHAFDISPGGPKMLGRFAASLGERNVLELSVQDACDMKFTPNSFDLVMGNSMLHHLDNFGRHLTDCFKILKPGGIALYGEPFVIGHVLVAAAMKTACAITERNIPAVNGYYKNISFKMQNNGDEAALSHLVDKHMFMREVFFSEVHRLGFSRIEIRPRQNFEFFRKGWIIDRTFAKLNIKDDVVREEARRIYQIMSEMFSERTYAYALPQFMDIVIQK
jgi:ubiquinone/menaquinone biosynthesis C-methylase UbiE